MKKVVKKTVTTVKATQPAETKVVKKKPVKKVVSKKKVEPEVDEETLNSIYDEIITVAAGLGESTDEYVAVIDEATSVLVEQDQEKLEGILASTKEQVESMASKKKPSKKPVKKVAPKKKVDTESKGEVGNKDAAPEPENEVVDEKETSTEGFLEVGTKFTHPVNGEGTVEGLLSRGGSVSHYKVMWESGKAGKVRVKSMSKYI